MDGAVVGFPRWLDRGRYTVLDGVLHGESERLEFVTLDGTLGSDGMLRITQDIVRNGTSVEYALTSVSPQPLAIIANHDAASP